VGSGPGFVAMDLARRVGKTGEVTLLEPSEMYLDYFKNYSQEKGWQNTKYISGTAEDTELDENHYDLIFARWVISFVPDPEKFINNLKKALAPGGIIAFQDYAFHGLYLYPQGGGYERLSKAVQSYWKYTGGDLTIAVRIPSILKNSGLQLLDYKPNSIAGSPGSGIFKWHDAFITHHVPLMVEKNILTKEDGDAILNDWAEHK